MTPKGGFLTLSGQARGSHSHCTQGFRLCPLEPASPASLRQKKRGLEGCASMLESSNSEAAQLLLFIANQLEFVRISIVALSN